MTITKILTPYNFTDKNSTARIKYLVIHYVGALGGAKSNCQYYAAKYIGASAHYFVGFDGEVFQGVEDADIAWHCGASTYKHPACRNSNSIGIELCVRKKNTTSLGATDKDWYFEDATITAAIELVKSLMKKYNIPASNVIRHYDVTGKVCPNPYVYNSTVHVWNEFKTAISVPTTTAPVVTALPYIITTTSDLIYIMAGAGTGFKITGTINEKAGHKNQYTITEEKNGYGKLKSGAGWINLKFTKRV